MAVPWHIHPRCALRIGMGSSPLLTAFSPGLRTSLNALCTAMLVFKMKAESNLNHLVAIKRAGSRTTIAIFSLLSPFTTALIDEKQYFSGDADSCRNKGLHLYNLYLLKLGQFVLDIVNPL